MGAEAGTPIMVPLVEAAPLRLAWPELLWSEEAGHAEIAPVRRVERETPLHLQGPASEAEPLARLREMFADPGYSTYPLFAARLQDVGLDLAYGFVQLADGRVVKETASVAEGTFGGLGGSELMREGLSGAETLTRPVLHLFHRATPAFGHFVLDGLVQLTSFLQPIKAGRLDVLVPPFMPAWSVQAMLLLGVPEASLQRPRSPTLRCRHLVTLSAMETLETFYPRPELVARLSDTILGRGSLASGRRIFLSRARQTTYSQRSVSNEAALIEMLVARGFEILEPGNMAFAEQARAFAEASVIVGPHGSAFGNLVFAQPGATVIDLMPADWVGYWGGNSAERWLLNLTTARRLRYELLLCPSRKVLSPNPNDPEAPPQTAMESTPDLALVASVLDSIGVSPRRIATPVIANVAEPLSPSQAPDMAAAGETDAGGGPPPLSTPIRRATLQEVAPIALPFRNLLWSREEGHTLLEPELRIERSGAFRLHALPSEAAKAERLREVLSDTGYVARPLIAARIGRVTVDMSYGFCLTDDGLILKETASVAEGIFNGLGGSSLLRQGRGDGAVLEKPVLHLFHRASGAYGHFLLDCLVPLLRFLPAIRAGYLDVLVPHSMPGWALAAMSAMGVPQQAIQQPEGATIFCSQIVVVSSMETYETFLPHPSMLARLAARMTAGVVSDVGRRIYLSRANQISYSQRSIVNEAELAQMLAARGFELLEPGNMSFADQVKAFAEASIIVGAHGSAFANLIFARPGATVIDLMPADWVDYWGGENAERWLLNLTTALDLNYELILCPSQIERVLPDEDQSGLQKSGMQSRVDLALVAEVLNTLPSEPLSRLSGTGTASVERLGIASQAGWAHMPGPEDDPANSDARPFQVRLREAAPRVMPFTDLLWGSQPGHAVLAPERHVARETAVHLHGAGSEPEKLAELRNLFADSGYGAPAVMAARLDDVSLDLAYAFVMDTEGRILQETANVAEQIFGDLAGADLLREGLAGAEMLTRPVLHLFHRSTPAYGHFVLDVLVPLMHFLPAIRAGQLDVLVPPFMPGWAVPALLALGVPETALQRPTGRTLRCRQLVTLSAIETRETFQPNPAMLAPMAAAAPLREARGSGRRIYLSRARQTAYSQRSLANEEALVAMLAARGFEILEPGNMPFAEQARAFAEAGIIIGAHGSAFGNLVFARPGAVVIDLMPADWVGYWGGRHAERWLLHLTAALRLHYEVVLCSSRTVQRELGEDQQGWQQTGMESTADVEGIARVLDSLGPIQPLPPAGPPEIGLAPLMDPALDPVFAWPECIGTNSAWWGHVPFAAWLVTTLRPRQLVELGSWRGVSYFSFCQAVLAAELDCRCHAVDSWEGDPHAGLYGPEVFEAFSRFNDALYSRVSTIHRMTFDSAAAAFEDGTVDLLHIDGLHTYDAVRHDFETWLPKMSPRGVILFHDATERQEGFGVWRLWEEVSAKWPGFLFPHSHGLGVLCVGAETAPELLALCGMPPAEAERVRHRFGLLGGRWQVQNQLLISQGQVRAMEQDLRRLQAEATRLAAEEARLRQIESSSTWRATAPLRKALGRFPAMASFVRKSLKVAWWAVTLQLPARLAQRRARPPS